MRAFPANFGLPEMLSDLVLPHYPTPKRPRFGWKCSQSPSPMLIIFESILPVFLLVVLGALLKRWPKIDGSLWNGLEQLGYYVLFPALLFATLAKADFGGIAAGATASQ